MVRKEDTKGMGGGGLWDADLMECSLFFSVSSIKPPDPWQSSRPVILQICKGPQGAEHAEAERGPLLCLHCRDPRLCFRLDIYPASGRLSVSSRLLQKSAWKHLIDQHAGFPSNREVGTSSYWVCG